MSYSFSYKIKCKASRVSADNSKWNLCYRGPKVRVNGSLWSLGNLIQEARANHICSNRERQPVPFFYLPFLLFILLVSSPYFKCSFFFLWYHFRYIPLFFFFSGPSSPVFLFIFGPLLLADGVISIVPVFSGIHWKHTRVHVTTHIHEHSVSVSVSLHLFPSSSSFISLSLSPFLQWQRGKVMLCRWWRSASWMNTMGRFCFYL